MATLEELLQQAKELETSTRRSVRTRSERDLTNLINQLRSDIQFTGDVAARETEDAFTARGIRGRLSSSRAAEARRASTSGLNRSLLRLTADRRNLLTGFEEEDRVRALQEQIKERSEQSRLGLSGRGGAQLGSDVGAVSIAGQETPGFLVGSPTDQRSGTRPRSRGFRLALSIPQVGTSPETFGFDTLEELQRFARGRGIRLGVAPGQDVTGLERQFEQAGIGRLSVGEAEQLVQRVGRRGVASGTANVAGLFNTLLGATKTGSERSLEDAVSLIANASRGGV